jgi:hypothetical protein
MGLLRRCSCVVVDVIVSFLAALTLGIWDELILSVPLGSRVTRR